MTSRLVKVIVTEFAQACNSGAPQYQDFVGGEHAQKSQMPLNSAGVRHVQMQL